MERSREERAQLEQKLQQLSEMSRLQLVNMRGDLERERNTALAKRDDQLRQAIERLEQERDAALAEQSREMREEMERLTYEHESALAERDERLRQAVDHLEKERDAAQVERDAALAEIDQRVQKEREQFARDRQQVDEHNSKLLGELTGMRRDKLRLLGEGMDKFLEAMGEKGVKFVSFQPGAGHITIAMDDLQSFVEDTEEFVAKKCGVNVEHYRRWLAHYTNPVCQGTGGRGDLCAKPLGKMLKPMEFIGGLHDRCDIHKQVPRSQAAIEGAADVASR
jgi:chromosome segregation ATPase